MTVVATAVSMQATLSQWLRLLWDTSPPLRLGSELPFIAGGVIHLPARSHWRLHAAAAAHATAHVVYSPRSFDGRGLGPIARTLTGLLEDARVEALAMRELPGLARLWRPLHTATPALGAGCDALMQRLARSLVDPAYDDPDAWVRKGCALFYLDADLGLPALRTPADVRRAATLLGNDIGALRLPFNAGAHRPLPAYRDDHRWMWAAELPNAAAPSTAALVDGASNEASPAPASEAFILHPEWDHLIARLRPDWCQVIESPASLQTALPIAADAAADSIVRRLGQQLRRPLYPLTGGPGARERSDDGESFDPDALVDWRLALRLRRAGEARVYRGVDRRGTRASVLLLIDQSASTAAVLRPSASRIAGGSSSLRRTSVLQAAASSAAAAAAALASIRVPFAIAGFSSHGRQAVRLVTVKGFDEAFLPARLEALRPAGSTRLGAALRHATRSLLQHGGGGGPLWVIVLSDGEPHDIDVHDPRYLVEDARHAVRAAARREVRVACLALGGSTPCGERSDLRRIFGPHGAQSVPDLTSLPRAVQRLLGAAPR